ncbi:LsbB family leaderless bacteriocin, partial [Enterococcus faecalis]
VIVYIYYNLIGITMKGGKLMLAKIKAMIKKFPNPYTLAAKLTTYEINWYKQQYGRYPWERPVA